MSSLTPAIVLGPGREKSLLRRHPWIFTGAIANLQGSPQSGETVAILAEDGSPLGWGAYSPQSQIAVRVWSFNPQADISVTFIRERLRQALDARAPLHLAGDCDAFRLVNAESDGLPGVVVDRYSDYLVCQFLSAGAEHWKATIVGLLRELASAPDSPAGPALGIYERSDVDVRLKEGLAPMAGLLDGQEPPDTVVIREGGCQFLVQIHQGHKTGFYLDQRDNRRLLAQHAAGREVLNCFSYTGGFGVWALHGGAGPVTNVDTSASALELSEANVRLNGQKPANWETVAGDAFQVMRRYRDSRREFDMVVLDPPKFAESRRQLDNAARGYKDINLLALKLLRPGGLLFTFSCSGLVTPDLFQKIVAGAALDSGREVQCVGWMRQAGDHPVALSFPEGEYLKGLICRVKA